ncbi:helix-turn-helix transcriptional regulator [Streptomyces sp. SID2888]|uniref:helix-turn-helix domain-containing protein n=1 Tax=Streptomyces sp. SID2888 TaxID=2690256 RepID=UPI001370E468|nr:helix-turn-helix transcriptional regulator [Streptomyces sp. SID2888]MYV44966.1 helix-turn-helix domain-containing protein [Streptomyces sp. SID2888]
MQYDRTLLRRATEAAGDKSSGAVARRLGVGRMTAWRLLNGHGRPDIDTAAAVERIYGLPTAALTRPIPSVEATA